MAAQNELKLTDSQTFTNYKKLLEIKDIDAVVIATSDNWHATCAMDALNAGKHVYVEKPLTRTIDEDFCTLRHREENRQETASGRAALSPIPKYKAVAELVKSGKYGQIDRRAGRVHAQHESRRVGRLRRWTWTRDRRRRATRMWIGTRSARAHAPAAWDPDRFFRWRKYYEYGSG